MVQFLTQKEVRYQVKSYQLEGITDDTVSMYGVARQHVIPGTPS